VTNSELASEEKKSNLFGLDCLNYPNSANGGRKEKFFTIISTEL